MSVKTFPAEVRSVSDDTLSSIIVNDRDFQVFSGVIWNGWLLESRKEYKICIKMFVGTCFSMDRGAGEGRHIR
jgi:hypothetical protein